MTADFRRRLLATTLLIGSASFATPVLAQDETAAADDAADEAIVVTGTRIARPNLEANSPIAVVTGEETVQNADVTLDTYLNTLPQVNPSATTTSNNPSNAGQATLDLRGLGPNRNLVLIDGRRPMFGGTSQVVDVNTIPQDLIERVEVVTGGAGAAYGADAIAGVVNFILRDDFEGINLGASYSNSLPEFDSREYRISGVIGVNMADGRGNIAFAVDYANREPLIKSQRAFAAQATSTTPTPPVGRFIDWSPQSANANPGNPIPQAAINAVFATYGVAAAQAPTPSLIHFNQDGTLFGGGTFNTPINVSNYRYDPLGLDPAGANQNFFPDFYSYNFDAINLLILPLERKSAFVRGNYEINDSFDFFVQAGFTEYTATRALAPTPIGVTIVPPDSTSPATFARSALLNTGNACRTATGAATQCSVTGLLIPVTNPFIPQDLRTLLAARTGDDRRVVGSGATEPFNMAYRFLGTGLRESNFTNQVIQGLVGLRGNIAEGWRYEAYYSWGRTRTDTANTGNVNVQLMQQLLEAPDGGASLCDGGFNPFGIQPLSADCEEFVNETGSNTLILKQNIASGYVQGNLAELPAGTMSAVLGVEHRQYAFNFDPGALFGPIGGLNTALPIDGTNKFLDFFGELLVPIMRNQPWAETLELTLGYRRSRSQANDILNATRAPAQWSDAYKAELSWAPVPELRVRASYQRSVRAPNIGELFAGGGAFPQIFDPCSIGTAFRQASGAAGAAICQAQGINPATFVATPGAQAALNGAPNVNLGPEKGDTFTVGAVFQALGITGSIDYYNIRVTDLIRIPDTNLFIAACFNYQGNLNQNLSPNNVYCSGIARSGGNIARLFVDPSIGGDVNSNFLAINRGMIKTSGIDVQLNYRLPTDWLQERSSLNLNLLVNYLIDFKEEELPGVVLDYAGTIGYFGQAVSGIPTGAQHPRWRGTLNAAWRIDPITLSTRIRYIDSMRNRAEVQYPGETGFTGPSSVWYFDFALETNVENMTFRIGLNNAFDRLPPLYSPNVQSGTDPGIYDVIGRRAYVSVRLRY